MVLIKIFALLAALGLAASQYVPETKSDEPPIFPFNLIFALATSPESTATLKTLADSFSNILLQVSNDLGQRDAGAGFLRFIADSSYGVGNGMGKGVDLVNNANRYAKNNPGSYPRTPIEYLLNAIKLVAKQAKITIDLVKSYIQAVRTIVSGLDSGTANVAFRGSDNAQFLGKSIGSGLKVAGEGNNVYVSSTTDSLDPYDYTFLQFANLLAGSQAPGNLYNSVANNMHVDYRKWGYENGANFENAAKRLE